MFEDIARSPDLSAEPARGLSRGQGWLGQIDVALEAGREAEPWEAMRPEELAGLLPAYHILSLLGRGGMAAVYLVEERKSGKQFALKLLPQELGDDPGLAARFKREARLLEGLVHPHIIGLHETGETVTGHLFYVMEYIPGEDLARRLAQSGTSLGEAVAILRQICEGVSHAHGLGILHRDLKPSNILLGESGPVKVGDFGLAVRCGSETATRLTVSGTAVGTIEYAAPEQLRGEAGSVASDIYSLGVIAYEILTGIVPRGSFDPPSMQRSTVDPGFDAVVLRALHPDPARRQASVEAFRDGLTAAHETALLTGSIEVLGAEQAQVLEKIYYMAISKVPESVRHFVEDKLLTPSGYRDSRSIDEALAQRGVTRDALDTLIHQRLLRLEHRGGVERVEISHDRLAMAVQASRDLRRAAEERRRVSEREQELRRGFRRKLAFSMGVAGVVLTGVWGWSQHAEARRQANAEASARRHLISMLEVSTGPMADQLEQLGRLAVFDSLDTAVERALSEYAPEVRDPAFQAIEARYWDSRGIRLAARGKREEAYQAFVTARPRWLALGKRVESVLSGVKAAEQQWQQGRVGAMAKTIEQTRPPQPSPGMEGQMIDTVVETAAARALLLRGLLTEATRRLDAVIPRIASLLAGPLPEGSMRVMLLGTQTAALTSLSEAQIQRGDFLKAEAAGSRSLEIIRQLRRIEPGNFRHATLEARALMMMVKIAGYRKLYVVKHDLLETQRSFVQGLQHRDPANVVWRGLLAASLGQSGSAQMEAGNPQEAMSSLREAARLMIEVAETDPTNEMWQWDAAGYLLQAGYGLTRLNQHVEAESYFRRAVERMMLFAGIPDSPSADRLYGLSAAIGNLGDCLKRQNRPDDAVTHYQALIDHAAVARGAAWIFIAAVAGHEIAEVERARGSLADAITRHRAAFPLWRRFFASLQEPDRPQPGWAWRHRPGAACVSSIREALESNDPEMVLAGRAMAREVMEVFFSEEVGGQSIYPAEDETVLRTIEEMLAAK